MELEFGFRAIRNSVGRQVPPDALRQSLLQEFARTSRVRMRRRLVSWTLAAAAVLIAIIALRYFQPATPVEASLQIPMEDGFLAVPFASQPAEGEFVRVVHTEVAPDTLTRMGVFVATASTESISVDLMVGQDDAPLAIRVDQDKSEDNKEKIQ